MHCYRCLGLGYCPKIRTLIVSDLELSNPEFLRSVRLTAYRHNISSYQWLDEVYSLYRDYHGWICDERGQEVLLDLEVFETPNIRTWFRDFCCRPLPEGSMPRVRGESKERVRVLATILRARFPVSAATWGVWVANDNRPPNSK